MTIESLSICIPNNIDLGKQKGKEKTKNHLSLLGSNSTNQ